MENKALLDQLRELEPSLAIRLDSCICRPCRDDISKITNHGFVPRWRKVKGSQHCYVPGCSDSVQRVTKLADKESLCAILDIHTENAAPDDKRGFPLCIEHYGVLYRCLNPESRKCKACNKRILEHTKSRKCPDPMLIQRFLQQNTDFSSQICAEDHICYSCYKAHLVIIKHINNTTSSTDQDLCCIIDQVKTELQDNQEICTQDQALMHSVRMSAVLVGETLLKQNAILLPEVFDYCERVFNDVSTSQGIARNQNLHDIVSSNWLLSQLSAVLEQHMAYRCSVKRYGTVFYRYGGDLLHALNVSLGQTRVKSNSQQPSQNESDAQFQKILPDVCLTLNSKCHATIQKMITENRINSHAIENIDIEKCISELDPDLWNAVCLTTQPTSSKAQRSVNSSHVQKNEEISLHMHATLYNKQSVLFPTSHPDS